MKIKQWDIKGFGKFKDYKCAPGPGFNMIYEANESGKSTLQAFIRAMLYGQKGGRKAKDGSLPPAKQYKPWNNDQYAGVLEYTLEDGSFYRVGRNFDKGTANIHDGVSNNLTQKFPQDKDIGPRFAEEHLGLDEATFDRSVFIRQLNCAIDDDGRKNLVEKLSNLNTTGSEDLSLTRAVNALDAALLERVGTGRSTTRPLDKVNIRLSELEQKKQALVALNERFLDTSLTLHERKGLLRELTGRLGHKRNQKYALRRRRLDTLRNELTSLRSEAAAVDDRIRNCRENLSKLSHYENVNEDSALKATMLLHDIKQTYETVEAEAAHLSELQNNSVSLKRNLDPEEVFRQRTESVEARLKEYTPGNNAKTDAKRAKKPMVPVILGGLLVAAMPVLYFITNLMAFLGAGLVVAAALLIYLLIPVKNIGSGTNSIDQALSEAGFKDMSDFLRYKENQLRQCALIDQNDLRIQEVQIHLSELQLKADTGKAQLAGILEQTGHYGLASEMETEVNALKKGIEDYKKIKEDLRLLDARKAGIEDQYAIRFMEAGNLAGRTINSLTELELALSEFTAVNIEQDPAALTETRLDTEISALEEQIKGLQLEIASLNTRMEQAPKDGELSSVIEEITLVQEKKAALEMTGSSLSLASQVLSEVALKLQRDYIPELNGEMSRMMGQITGGRYNAIRTNDELQVNLEVPENAELIPVSRLSGGTVDQVYFSMRLAAVRLLERGREPLPLFMDEPFSQYDEERVSRAFTLLKEISKERQIFFFTCREREFELAQSVFGSSMNRIGL